MSPPRSAAPVLELVEEDLGGGDRAEQVDLDHLAVVVALVGREGAEEHDAGVVDQDVRAAELVLDALRCGDEAVAVGDVGLRWRWSRCRARRRGRSMRSTRRARSATR